MIYKVIWGSDLGVGCIPGDSSRDRLIPKFGGHDSPLKGSLNHPKKVTEPVLLETWQPLGETRD